MEGRSEIRNRVIARVFKELGYIEQWGSGIARIKSACKAQGLVEPRTREKGDFVDVEFYRPMPDAAAKMPDRAGSMPAEPQATNVAVIFTITAMTWGRVKKIPFSIANYHQSTLG
jgi:predicted HTH transcriptional regulator